MRRRQTAAMASAVLMTSLLAACSSDDSGRDAVATDTTAVAGTPVAVEAGETSATDWYLTTDVESVAAGPTTFTLTNTGTQEHEMVVFATETPFDEFEVDDQGRVSEDEAVGEVAEINEGTTGSVTLDLDPGSYVLACNLPLHYGYGMTVPFTVT